MDNENKQTFRRLIGEFKNTGSLLEVNGERPDLIAEAMIEAGLQALIHLAGPEKVAAEFRNIADRLDRKGAGLGDDLLVMLTQTRMNLEARGHDPKELATSFVSVGVGSLVDVQGDRETGRELYMLAINLGARADAVDSQPKH
ncbi:hypothetical protein KHP60_04530 [Microvirga sp. 3-52]|uniref:hypothetical protein n=1 Tax=Microvirga sp. 3-52 TaxID=2792425 RepID=UPI001AD0ABC1|nr:hypothetical protein [Microvirga sp. 3-52]MBO1904001.1 hypothetical protein [Microvirga sp. 3-52]MBS7451612.1 hypothetical protein [Microvirga sp. 3-52]